MVGVIFSLPPLDPDPLKNYGSGHVLKFLGSQIWIRIKTYADLKYWCKLYRCKYFLFVRLTILQRLANEEYIGELYVERDFKVRREDPHLNKILTVHLPYQF